MLDMRPVSYCVCIITSHNVAEQVSKSTSLRPYSVDKSPTMGEMLPIIGEHSIIAANGEKWKHLRRLFNAGFQPNYLITLLPRIVDKTKIFFDILDNLATSGEEFKLLQLTINLTFDIIGAVTLNSDMTAQSDKPHAIVRDFAAVLETFRDGGWQWLAYGPQTWWTRRSTRRSLDRAIKALVREKFDEVKRTQSGTGSKSTRQRSVLALSLQDIKELDAETLDIVTHQIQSFLFAGHDTTATVLAWAIYNLWRTPRTLATLRAEIDDAFGPDASPAAMAEALETRGEDLINKLTYTSAVIKETLRLFPPAGSARMAPPGSGFFVTLDDGRKICMDGCVAYITHSLVGRDERVYGPDADEFVPERWLEGNNVNTAAEEHVQSNGSAEAAEKSSNEDKIPPSSWRPFERGPRNCIGQALANLEARVILACVVRRYDFEKVGVGALAKGPDGKGIFEEGKDFYKVEEAEMFNVSSPSQSLN